MQRSGFPADPRLAPSSNSAYLCAVDDPERERLEQLSARVAAGTLSEAEAVEVEMHLHARPELATHMQNLVAARRDDDDWVARVEGEAALEKIENSGLSRVERALGLGLFLPGFALLFVLPFIGAPMVLVGTAILAWSVLRVRLATFQKDPYRNIDK